MKREENSAKEIARRLVLEYISSKPTRIRLRLDLKGGKSSIEISGESLNTKVRCAKAIDFNSFGNGVLEAYERVFGKLKEIPISLRETVYENERVRLDFYPTGTAGIFDIFVNYR